METPRDEMVRVNLAQRAYYSGEKRSRLVGGAWRAMRSRLDRLRSSLGIRHQVYDWHRAWLGDLSGQRVLDLGCFSGNALSVEIAERAGSYLGIDLAAPAIEALSTKLAHIDTARAEARDFLELPDSERFDVIYAYSVLHHFRHLDAALDRLDLHLAPGGLLITYDPLQTSVPVWLARRLYRPFQPDSAWEWPFDRRAIDSLLDRFDTVAVQGVLGRAKWALPLSLVMPNRAAAVGRRWHERDLAAAQGAGRGLYRCMHLTACLRKRSPR